MTEPRKKKLEELDREITQSKNIVNSNESFILAQLTKYKTPEKEDPLIRTHTDPISTKNQNSANCFTASNVKQTPQPIFTPEKTRTGAGEPLVTQDIITYITSIKKLQGTLEEKSYIMEVDYQKQRLNYQSRIQRLQKEIEVLSYDLEQRNRQVQQKDSTINVLRSQIKQLQAERDKQKEEFSHCNKETLEIKKENLELKLQNKKYKADNKVIMNHIDILTRQTKSSENKKKTLEEREMRVMKSLYQVSIHDIELRQAEKQYQALNSLSNKVRLDDATDRNGQLKSLIRRLNEQIAILKSEKALLLEESKEKAQNLENQKKLLQLSQQASQKLQDVISKMGMKVMTLEQGNQNLRQALRKATDGADETDEYISSARVKVGQFYYKR